MYTLVMRAAIQYYRWRAAIRHAGGWARFLLNGVRP